MNTASAPSTPVGEVGGEGQPATLGIGLDQRLEPRLPDRHPAGVEAVDLGRVLVDAGHMVAEIGEAGAGHEPDIAGADHRDTHACSCLSADRTRRARASSRTDRAQDEQAASASSAARPRFRPKLPYIGAALPMNVTTLPKPPRVGLVSLGCPKALVDSERIMTKLRADGYDMSPDYAGADVVLVNTCGFLDSAKDESLEAIGEAIAENGRVVVTGCMGKEADVIRDALPATCSRSPGRSNMRRSSPRSTRPRRRSPTPFIDLVPEAGLKLTPRHYSYVKISEGCNHRCAFCIIPHAPRRPRQPPPRRDPARGREARRRRDEGTAGHQPGHVGLRRRPPPQGVAVEGRRSPRPHDRPRARAGQARRLGAAPLRLPLPARRQRHPADGRGAGPPLPRHPVPAREPQGAARDAPPGQRREGARSASATGASRSPTSPSARASSSASPARPKRTSNICSTGSRKPSSTASARSSSKPVEGARRQRSMPDQVPEEVKQERYERDHGALRADQRREARRQGRLDHRRADRRGRTTETGGATGRSKADAPEIDGEVHLRDAGGLKPGDIVTAKIEDSDEHDLFGVPA